MSYHHLTITERIKIETYLELSLKPIQIARKLGVHKSTLSRELRPCNDTYSAQASQTHYEKLTKQKGRKSSQTPELKQEIEERLQSSWSPEQIYGPYQLENKPMVSFKTIYNWLYAGRINASLSVLRRKGKSRLPQETRGKFTIDTSISKHPKEVKTRKTVAIGNWIRSSLLAKRVKGVWQLLSIERHVCTQPFRYLTALQNLCSQPFKNCVS